MSDAQRETHTGGFAQFRMGWEGDWVRLTAELSELGRRIAENVAQAVAGIDFEAIGREAAEQARQAAEAAQAAAAGWEHGERTKTWRGPFHVHVDVHAQPHREAPGASPPDSRVQARRMVLNLVAEGRLTAEEGARLLEALG